ncbi:MAG: flagellar biosynthetic protein FliO [Burkholderiaceae bacterium]|jgi:flagellar protein FliO/FliZ|nr:flagellar biosynthetic protein FliO [Burkholderiaceae bacterium]
MDAMPAGLSALLWFAVVVAAIPLALWLLKRTPIGAAATAPGLMRTVAVLPLAPGQRLMTVEVGQGESRRWLVLGVTGQQITTLHEMPPGADAPAASSAAALPFAQLLSNARPRPRSDRAA